jgi:hypothetical protein
LLTPNRGEGLFEQEGWRAGMRSRRELIYTRSAGSNTPTKYDIRWIGDTGTFHSASTIVLTRLKPAVLKIDIAPHTIGIHSAIVQLVDRKSKLPIDERLCTIVAAEQFSVKNGFTIERSGIVPHPGVIRYFFNVPPGAQAFSVDLTVPQRDVPLLSNPLVAGELLRMWSPEHTVAGYSWLYFAPTHKGRRWAQTVVQPMSGVWEIDVTVDRPNDDVANTRLMESEAPTTYKLHTAVFATEGQLVHLTGGAVRVMLRNKMASFAGNSIVITKAASVRQDVLVTPAKLRATAVLDVPRSATQVFARIDGVSPPNADISVYLFSCSKNKVTEYYYYQGMCEFRSSGSTRKPIATTANPTSWVGAVDKTIYAGRWVAVVNAFRVKTPTIVKLSIGYMLASELRVRASPKIVNYGDSWEQTIRLPHISTKTSVRINELWLNLLAQETLTIWQPHTPDTVAARMRQKPSVVYTYAPVWSTYIPIGVCCEPQRHPSWYGR